MSYKCRSNVVVKPTSICHAGPHGKHTPEKRTQRMPALRQATQNPIPHTTPREGRPRSQRPRHGVVHDNHAGGDLLRCNPVRRRHLARSGGDGMRHRKNPPQYHNCPHGLYIGEPIPGSKFVRDYCTNCGTPIRVYSTAAKKVERQPLCVMNFCEDCDPIPREKPTPQSVTLGGSLSFQLPSDLY